MNSIDQAMQLSNYSYFASRKRVRMIIKEIVSCHNDSSILDIGCGYGNVSFPLLFLGYDVIGIDSNSKAVKICNHKNTFQGEFYTCDAQSFSLDKKFDIIICSEIMEHLSNPECLLRCILSHSYNKTKLIITIPNALSIRENLSSRFGLGYLKTIADRNSILRTLFPRIGISVNQKCFENQFDRHTQYFTFGKIKKLLAKEGFTIQKVYNLGLGISFWTLDKIMLPIVKLEYKIGKLAPHNIAGGWLIVCELK